MGALGSLAVSITLWAHVIATCPIVNDTIDLTAALDVTHLDASALDFCAEYTNISRLLLANNSISTIADNTFVNFYFLEHLDLSYNLLTDLPEDVFQSLWTLKTLIVAHNNLTRLSANLLQNKYELISVNFDYNNISEVEFGFVNAGHEHLLEVSIQYNSLEVFEPWPYQIYKHDDEDMLQYFHLEHNRIREIRNSRSDWYYDSTSMFPHNRNVNLMYNQFTTLEIDAISRFFENYEELTQNGFLFLSNFLTLGLNVTNNPYFCDCSLYSFSYILRHTAYKWTDYEQWRYRCHTPSELYGEDWLRLVPYEKMVCNLTQDCPPGCFCQARPYDGSTFVNCTGANLQEMPDTLPTSDYKDLVLILDDNHIQELTATNYAQNILNISLAGNRMHSLDADIVKSMTRLKKIDLRGNSLKELPNEIQRLDFGDVTLEGNPLRCHCDMTWMGDWIRIARNTTDKELRCTEDGGQSHRIVDVSESSLRCSLTFLLTPVLSSVGVLAILIVGGGIFAYRCPYETKVILYRIFCMHAGKNYKTGPDEAEVVYDGYCSFDTEDFDVRQWVITEVSKKLRKKFKDIRIFNPMIDISPLAEDNAWQTERSAAMDRALRIFIVLSEGTFTIDTQQQFDINYAENLVNLNPEADDRLIYIFYNDRTRLHIQEEPWISRLSRSRVLDTQKSLFYPKLYYEMIQAWKEERRPSEFNASNDDHQHNTNHVAIALDEI